MRVAAWLVRWVVQVLGWTCRVEVAEGGEHLETLEATAEEKQPVILSFWHQRTVLAIYLVFHRLVRRGVDVTMLISQSRDGELAAHLARHWRLRQVRGSATRGGREALRAIYKTTRAGSSPVMIPDGPHGPRHHFKAGVAVLAQMTQAPILPIGFAARRVWKLRSWDRLMVPKPFSRIVVVVGAPQSVPRNLDSAALEIERARLETVIDDVTARAERHAGAMDDTVQSGAA